MPPVSYVKFNVHGSSVLQSQHFGGGVIILRDDGSVFYAFSHYFGPDSCFMAELSALLVGLEVCQQFSLSNVLVKMDALVVVTALQENLF